MSYVATEIEFHPDAPEFPEISDEQYAGLRESINEFGQILPVVLFEGKCIDGRARLKACAELGIKPKVEILDQRTIGDIAERVEALNRHRRHLTESQLAMRALSQREQTGESIENVARQKGVSSRLVSTAIAVKRDGVPELVKQVEDGKAPLGVAKNVSRLPKESQLQAVHKIESGDIKSVRAETKPKPKHVEASKGRPSKSVADWEDSVESILSSDHKVEAIRRLLDSLDEGVRAVVLDPYIGKPEPRVEQPAEKELLTDELIDSPDMLQLEGGLDVSKATAIGIVRLLYAFAEQRTPDGKVGAYLNPAIAKACDWDGNPDLLVNCLIAANFLLPDTEHRLLIVDWSERCPMSVHEKLEAAGKTFVEPVGRPPEPKPKKGSTPKKPERYSDEFERFWAACSPVRKTKKAKAWESWKNAIKTANPPEGRSVEDWLVERMGQYAKSYKGSGKYCQEPAVWLNGGCWDDDDASWKDYNEKDSATYPEAFERFWSACSPLKKTKKADAWEAWQEAIKTANPPEGRSVEDWLVERMGQYAKSDRGRGKYCQEPGVWLSKGCWDDDDASWKDFKEDDPNSVEVRRPMKPVAAFVAANKMHRLT